ncbi:MAG TPA: DUF1697 domain-containing protein [Fimbriimonadaceae bacterium]|jgi:uncharacterized protein (DUF1697 family)
MGKFVGLLRGINVGGNRKVAMVELKTFLENLGFEKVKTILQSGNFVFTTNGSSAELEKRLEQEAEKKMGLKIDFHVRSQKEWSEVIKANPFPKEAEDDPSHLVVLFLKSKPDGAQIKAVQDQVKGREIIKPGQQEHYITYPDNIGDSKLGSVPGFAKLTAQGTGRNWNTVLRLQKATKEI